ncbi:MAG: Mur ligase domain-containing protein [Candidatus Saccharimonadales bacterium]
MHIFFSGIGGTGIGPLAVVAKQAGHEVSGSDKQESLYLDYLRKHGVNDISVGQTHANISAAHLHRPIDWYVYSSAVAIEQPNSPEFQFCRENGIRMSKRDELLNEILSQKNLKLIAIAGTHGKTTTTAMTVWTMKQLGIPLGYILPAKSSFAEMGAYEEGAQYFVYECDEFDRNFLQFTPHISIISGIDWDHPDIYPTREEYYQAFRTFIKQSQNTYLWSKDAQQITVGQSANIHIQYSKDYKGVSTLAGKVNRANACLVARACVNLLEGRSLSEYIRILNMFPGVSRRFEQITPGLYSDYAHTPEKIRGALQLGHEVAGDNLVVVYEGLHNTRQHFIRSELGSLFDGVKKLYVVPSYLAREDETLELLTPEKLIAGMNEVVQANAEPAALEDNLKQRLQTHLDSGDTVLCLSAGGGGSLDEWLRREFRS